MVYCGCDTQGGKIRWGIAVLLAALTVGFHVGGIVEMFKCEVCDPNGNCSSGGFKYSNVNGRESIEDSEGTIIEGASTASSC